MSNRSPSVEERYTVATNARSLLLRDNSAGSVDVLIAAGWAGDGMGISLLRLLGEYDSAMSAVKGTGNNGLTERVLALMQMRSLPGTKAKLGELGRQQSWKIGFRGSARDVDKLMGRCLDVFLSPICPACEGRGFNGGGRHEQTGPPELCRPCKGTGRRDQAIGRNADERSFARHILSMMERATQAAESRMREILR